MTRSIAEAIQWALPGVDMASKPTGELLEDACLKVFAEGISPINENVKVLRKGLIEMNQRKAINPKEQIEIKKPDQIEDGNSIGLRPLERKVLENLADAWNTYMLLPRPSDDEIHDFGVSIDRCNDLIARRVAKRVDPDIWA